MTTPRPRSRPAASAADYVADDLQRRIAEQGWPAGRRIGTKVELCAEYQVAPATLGEALRVLRARDAVEVRPGPGGGIFVAAQSPLIRLAYEVLDLRQAGTAVNDVVEVLDALDDAVLQDAARHRTDTDLAELDALLAELETTWHRPSEGLHPNWRLHRRIAEISPNVVLRTFYRNLVDYITAESETDVTLGVIGLEPTSDERLQVHRDLVEAIRHQDPDDVAAASRAHRTAAEH
ncbi:MAG TPA: FCD domain-containing protein [Cellulomonas sp.]